MLSSTSWWGHKKEPTAFLSISAKSICGLAILAFHNETNAQISLCIGIVRLDFSCRELMSQRVHAYLVSHYKNCNITIKPWSAWISTWSYSLRSSLSERHVTRCEIVALRQKRFYVDLKTLRLLHRLKCQATPYPRSSLSGTISHLVTWSSSLSYSQFRIAI